MPDKKQDTPKGWEAERVFGSNRDETATNNVREFMKNPNARTQYKPDVNPILPKDQPPPAGMERIAGENL